MAEKQKDPSEWDHTTKTRSLCYEVWPDWAVVEGVRVQVGFEVDLCATCGDQDAAMTGGYERWVETFEDLKALAKSALPAQEGSEAGFEVLPYDNSIHESPQRGFRPEVDLAIRIVHKHRFEQPVDDCESHCLAQVESRLKELGIRRAH